CGDERHAHRCHPFLISRSSQHSSSGQRWSSFCTAPLPKTNRGLHNARPATVRSTQSATRAGRGSKILLHRVLTFFETALRCAAPQTETAFGPGRKGRLKSTPSQGVD